MTHRNDLRWLRFGATLLCLSLLAVACGDSDDADSTSTSSQGEQFLPPTSSTSSTETPEATTSTAAPATSGPASSAPATSASETTTPATTAAPEPTTTEAPFSTDVSAREGDGQGTPSGQLVDVRMAAQDGFDRFVLEFAGSGIPMWRVRYVEGVVSNTADEPVPGEGVGTLQVIAFPARTVDIEDPDFTPTYDGPLRFSTDTRNITEAAFVEDFEANMAWVLGVGEVTGFEVTTLSDPPRIVVDVSTR